MRLVANVAVVLNAVTAGALFVFSSFIMTGLRQLDDSAATTAMRSINRAAGRSALLVPLLGGAVAALAVALWALLGEQRPGATGWLLAGGVSGVATMLITAAYHIPRNDALERGEITWARYVEQWVPVNHLRVATSVAAAVLILVGLSRS